MRIEQAVNVRSIALSIAVAVFAVTWGASLAQVAPAGAPLRTLKKEPAADQLVCGQKVLVEDQTCPAGQILEVTGSCLNEKELPGTPRRGRQFNCIPRKK